MRRKKASLDVGMAIKKYWRAEAEGPGSLQSIMIWDIG
jgi:hypothetical protein